MKKLHLTYFIVISLLVVTFAYIWPRAKTTPPASANIENSAQASKEWDVITSATYQATKKPKDILIPKKHNDSNSSLTRGHNKRFVLNPATELVRPVIPGKCSNEELFKIRSGEIRGPLTINSHTLSAIEATFDDAAFSSFLSSDASNLWLPLTSDQNVEVEVKQIISRGDFSHTMIGQVKDNLFSDVLMVIHDGAISGSIDFIDTNTHYEYAMAGNGDVAIRKVDHSSYTERCGTDDEHQHEEAELLDHHADAEASTSSTNTSTDTSSPQSTQTKDHNTIEMDSVIGYSIEARKLAGGVAAIEAKIIASVDRMNTAFDNSKLHDLTLTLLATIEDPDYLFPGTAADTMKDELMSLSNKSDGTLDTISDLRTALGADQSTFITGKPDGVAGYGYRPGSSMIVSSEYMTPTRLTFVHELGHNLGCNHSWGDSSSASNTDANNYGWRMILNDESKVRTVMAYDWNWVRIPYFSNPKIVYHGSKTGAEDGYDASDDPTCDPRYVRGGKAGSFGEGFSGANLSLGANNANCIAEHAEQLADNDDRVRLKLLDPASGVYWLPGHTYNISWYGSGELGLVMLDLYKNGEFVHTIAEAVSGATQWHSWDIPPSLIAGSDYVIRLTLQDGTYQESKPFNILIPHLTDSDGDGVNDFLENVLGMDVNTPDSTKYYEHSGNGDMLYTVRNLKTGVTYTVQTNASLTASDGWGDFKVLNGRSGGSPTKVSIPTSQDKPLFIRLLISQDI